MGYRTVIEGKDRELEELRNSNRIQQALIREKNNTIEAQNRELEGKIRS